jgi:nitrogen regulatory protein PII
MERRIQMNSETPKKDKVFSPSRTVWRTQMAKGVYTPHRASRITCIINNLLTDKVAKFVSGLGVTAYVENGRVVREYIKPRPLGLPGEIINLHSSGVDVYRFTVPRESTREVIESIINVAGLDVPGRGTVFSQDLMEFSKEPPVVDLDFLKTRSSVNQEVELVRNLSYVNCVLSTPGSGDHLARIALDLGICVPLITFGTGNDIRDQLGLIRITISAEKEIVHLIMPEEDSQSIIRLLIEQARLDRPGRGFIYQTPVSIGLIDTRLKIGMQRHAASLEQIIAAIDSLKSGTSWRRRLDADQQERAGSQSMMPQDNCEVSIISEEDRIDMLREACLRVGAMGATTSRVLPQAAIGAGGITSTMIRSAISVPADIIDNVVDELLDVSTIKKDVSDRIQVLDSPAAYVHSM